MLSATCSCIEAPEWYHSWMYYNIRDCVREADVEVLKLHTDFLWTSMDEPFMIEDLDAILSIQKNILRLDSVWPHKTIELAALFSQQSMVASHMRYIGGVIPC